MTRYEQAFDVRGHLWYNMPRNWITTDIANPRMNMKPMGSISMSSPVNSRSRLTFGTLMEKVASKTRRVKVATSHRAFKMKNAKLICAL